MKVVFVSNYLTHHQLPFCCAMNEKLGADFCFIETERMEQERIDLGWQTEKTDNISMMKSYIDDKAYQEVCREIREADVVIIGGTKDEYIAERLQKNKIIFRYEERIFKESWFKLLKPQILHMIYVTHVKNLRKRVYMLCAGAYLSQELKLFHLYKGKMFKWGYFPKTYYYDLNELIEKKNHEIVEILWCARFIAWKHPEKVIVAAKELAQQGLEFHITMIGDGKLRMPIENEVLKNGLGEYISFSGAIPSGEVRGYMEKANIFLATSDRNEGWGAVINEAMNSGCAVVADRMMGAVPYLIQNGENGYAYKSDRECHFLLKSLIQEKQRREQIGIRAYKTIVEQWNAEKAAENLLKIIKSLYKGESINTPAHEPGSIVF